MQTVEIPIAEYQRLKEELSLLKDTDLLKRINKLLDIMYQDKYGLYMGDYTDDLTEAAFDDAWEADESEWDKL